MAITYRTTDLGQWGTGQGSNLSAAQVDANFWTLYEAIQSVSAETGVGVASASVSSDQLTFTLTDATTLGPFKLPTITLNPRGAWAASTVYSVNDLVTASGNLYLVIYDHTSASSFVAGANDGAGHDYYGLLLEIPGNTIPSGGTTGQVLSKNSGTSYDMGWSDFALDGLSDVDVTEGSGIDGQFLKWDNTASKWVASSDQLSALSDVSITGSPTTGDVLTYNGAVWEPGVASTVGALSDLSDVLIIGTPTTGYYLKFNGTEWVPAYIRLSALNNVNVSENSGDNGKFLKWNNSTSKWVASYVPGQFAMASLTDAATITWDATSPMAYVILSGNRTLATPTNMVAGGTYVLVVNQDATGSRTLALPGIVKTPGGTGLTLSTAPSAIDVITFYYDGNLLYAVANKAFS